MGIDMHVGASHGATQSLLRGLDAYSMMLRSQVEIPSDCITTHEFCGKGSAELFAGVSQVVIRAGI